MKDEKVRLDSGVLFVLAGRETGKLESMNSRSVGFFRFLFLLGLSVWLGGLAFIAVGAPAMFKVNRALGPQLVGAAMGAFTPVTYVCAALMLVGWLAELRNNPSARAVLLCRAQGVCIAAMLIIAVYAGRVVMPDLTAMQPQVVQIAARNPNAKVADNPIRARFDKAHKQYRSLTSLVVLLGLTTLGIFCARVSRKE